MALLSPALYLDLVVPANQNLDPTWWTEAELLIVSVSSTKGSSVDELFIKTMFIKADLGNVAPYKVYVNTI